MFSAMYGKGKNEYKDGEPAKEHKLTYVGLVLNDVGEHGTVSVEEWLIPPQSRVSSKNLIDGQLTRCFRRF